MSKCQAYISEFLLIAFFGTGCDWIEMPRENVEYNDTDTIAFGLTTRRSIQEIASNVSNITVFCQRHTRYWDSGVRLSRIQGFQRIATFDDRGDFVRIMEMCRRIENQKSAGSSVYNRILPMYYIVFYYWKEDLIMVFPVKFDENFCGDISPWSEEGYTYSNKTLFRWLKELNKSP